MKFKVITIENLSKTLSDSSWTEGFDGGSAVTVDLQFVADGVYHSVMKSDIAHSNITSQQSGTYYVIRKCAFNEE